MTGVQRASGGIAARSLWAGALVLPLSGVLLLAAGPPARAAVTAPGNGAVIVAHDTFEISADYESPLDSQLRLTAPGADQSVLLDEGNPLRSRNLTYSFDTLCWDGTPNPCSTDRPAPNGDWTVQQVSGGTPTRTSSFRLRIPARSATDVVADGSVPQKVSVSWRHGREPDLTGFAVFDGEKRVKTLERDDCTGGKCATVLDYQADEVGLHTYTVRTFRSTGVADEPSLESRSQAVSATVLPGVGVPGPDGDVVPGTEASPVPSGTPVPSGSPASDAPDGSPSPAAAGPGGADATANAAAARRQAFSTGFSTFGPKLGVPKLPPLPQAPAVAQIPDGTFEPTLGFEEQEVSEPGPPGGVAARVTSTAGTALVSEELVRGTAGALVLFLTGAHLRRWLNAAPPG